MKNLHSQLWKAFRIELWETYRGEFLCEVIWIWWAVSKPFGTRIAFHNIHNAGQDAWREGWILHLLRFPTCCSSHSAFSTNLCSSELNQLRNRNRWILKRFVNWCRHPNRLKLFSFTFHVFYSRLIISFVTIVQG